jgi:hypothetical protein
MRALLTTRTAPVRFTVLLLAIGLVLPAASFGWTPKAQKVITAEAAKLAPPDLYRLIKKHQHEFEQGVLAPYSETDPTRHYKNDDGTGQLDRVIETEVAGLISMIESHQPFETIVERLGRLSYFVSMANNPLNTSARDRSEGSYFKDYAQYVESAAPRLPVIFYGLDADLEAGDLGTFVDRLLDRGRLLYPSIVSEYRRIGKLPGSRYFDDRSTAFGVSSVAYSRAVSDVALVLRYVWIKAGGADDRATPHEDEGRLLKVTNRIVDGDKDSSD